MEPVSRSSASTTHHLPLKLMLQRAKEIFFIFFFNYYYGQLPDLDVIQFINKWDTHGCGLHIVLSLPIAVWQLSIRHAPRCCPSFTSLEALLQAMLCFSLLTLACCFFFLPILCHTLPSALFLDYWQNVAGSMPRRTTWLFYTQKGSELPPSPGTNMHVRGLE